MSLKKRKKLNKFISIKNNFIWLVLYVINMPILLIIIIIYPFIKIRIIELETRSIGHFSLSVEIFLNELILNIQKKKEKFIFGIQIKKLQIGFY